LRSYLGGEDVAGGKLKESGTSHWQKPNAGATNESGFTALPGGSRGIVGTGNKGKFGGQGVVCYWWSVTGISAEPFSQIFGFCINKDYSRLFRNEFYFTDGISIRCLKD
ncbi:MAG: FISUMP domain-containing protein, partial [Bacteroidota bacterium]|nr:FISUMP domain-containing protein [Bacteroidota bacterium]